jgi:hypothetical protein
VAARRSAWGGRVLVFGGDGGKHARAYDNGYIGGNNPSQRRRRVRREVLPLTRGSGRVCRTRGIPQKKDRFRPPRAPYRRRSCLHTRTDALAPYGRDYRRAQNVDQMARRSVAVSVGICHALDPRRAARSRAVLSLRAISMIV